MRVEDVSMEIGRRKEGLKRCEEGQGSSERMMEMKIRCRKLEMEVGELIVEKERLQGKFEQEKTQMTKCKKAYHILKKCIQQLEVEVELINLMWET